MSNAPASISYLPGVSRPACVRDAQPGDLFVLADKLALFAPLNHQHVDVVDTTHRWCVVIAARTAEAGPPGKLVAIPCSTPMTKMRVIGGLQIGPVDQVH
jgi:hypothetical protein